MFTMVGGTKAYYIAADGEKLGRRSVLSGYLVIICLIFLGLLDFSYFWEGSSALSGVRRV